MHAKNKDINGNFGDAQKRKLKENFSLREYIIDRMLVEIWMVKAVLMRSRMEVSNMLLETGEKAVLFTK